jgi:hypothetical protein
LPAIGQELVEADVGRRITDAREDIGKVLRRFDAVRDDMSATSRELTASQASRAS